MGKCFLLLVIISLVCTQFVMAGSNTTSVDDNTVTDINVHYKTIPEKEIVHVTKQIIFLNNNPSTNYWRGYYSNYNYYLPENARNISSYDDDDSLTFRQDTEGFYVFNFNRKVWHEESYTFYLEYDLNINKNTAVFYMSEYGDNTAVSLEIPSDFDTHLAREDYSLERKKYSNIYKFEKGLAWSGPCLVKSARSTDYSILEDTVQLQQEEVGVRIRYWEGEEEWAREMMDTTTEFLPILEVNWGIPYPVSYNITITQANITETGGYGGYNEGSKGIWMLHTSSNEILIHELAHYWTRACNFNQLWMDEGYADLYTYIALNQTTPEKAEKRKVRFLEKYESLKVQYEVPLSEWSTPDKLNSMTQEEVDFTYKKAFALTYTLYEDLGIEAMKKSNREFLKSKNQVDEDMFISIINSSSENYQDQIKNYIY
ncbi:hypothetical protein CUN85_06105 [Methanolobus halotolerans]|uniref:Peptidase M1 membrane alanine aminopeptidase domain-containing protein n=2 Tax=Methanolobus halotolerans TaxID=2052935 RepID=A0A4E0PXG7_9EURY|nr:hypothetical protein CUN85_06105 [Methanolobus halotolerans]